MIEDNSNMPEITLSSSLAAPENAVVPVGNEASLVDIPDGWVTAAEVARESLKSAAGRVAQLAAGYGLEYEPFI